MPILIFSQGANFGHHPLVHMELACNFTSVGKHKFMHAHIAKYTQLSSKQKHIIIVIGVRWSGVFCHRLVYAGDMIT